MTPTAHPTRTLLILLAVVLVIVGFVYAITVLMQGPQRPTVAPLASVSFPAGTPAPTAADYVAAQKGFQYLVSYTSTGFAPTTLSVKKGETIRFTNNSNSTLRLSLPGAAPLAHGAYFEYTFDKADTLTVADGGANTIQVTVK